MECGIILELIEIGAAIAPIIAGVYEYSQTKKLSFYEQYTERFAHIMELMPEPFFTDRIPTDAEKEQINHCIRLYIDLCSEELHHKKHDRIATKDWKEVVEGIRISCSNKYIQEFFASTNILQDYKELKSFIDSNFS